jgi:arylsulfatase A-like enzyme
LIDRLRDEGLLQNTVIIVAGDHGEQFGEHGLHVHGNSLFLPNLHVPLLVVSGDRLPGGTRVGTPVSIRDIPATVMSLSGVTGGTFTGQSLDRYWTDVAADSVEAVQGVFSELTDIRGVPTTKSLIVGRYHYIWGENRVEALFDLISDPGETTNLVARENLELVTRMRRLMAPHIRNDAALWERLPQN